MPSFTPPRMIGFLATGGSAPPTPPATSRFRPAGPPTTPPARSPPRGARPRRPAEPSARGGPATWPPPPGGRRREARAADVALGRERPGDVAQALGRPVTEVTLPPETPAVVPARPPGAGPFLLVLRGQKRNAKYPICEGPNYIGRADEQPVDI